MNESGIKPVEYKVLVMPEQVKTESDGGIVFTQDRVDDESLAQTEGILIEKTDMAFDNWRCDKPVAGDKVKFAKYSGLMVEGKDGKQYRIINDKDIVAIMETDK